MLDRVEGKLRGRIEKLLGRLERVIFGNVYVEVGTDIIKVKCIKTDRGEVDGVTYLKEVKGTLLIDTHSDLMKSDATEYLLEELAENGIGLYEIGYTTEVYRSEGVTFVLDTKRSDSVCENVGKRLGLLWYMSSTRDMLLSEIHNNKEIADSATGGEFYATHGYQVVSIYTRSNVETIVGSDDWYDTND